MNPAIGEIVGKTITSVLVSEDNTSGPSTQVFLVFDDGTTYELYGDIHATSGLDPRGEAAVLRYAARSGGWLSRFTGGTLFPQWSRNGIEWLDVHRS